jgi:hypothetical protein
MEVKEIIEKIKTLEDAKIILHTRFSTNPCKSSDGGDYNFWTEYEYGGGGFIKDYMTSADLSHCNVLGKFQDCNSCNYYTEDFDCDSERIISEKQLIEELKEGIFITERPSHKKRRRTIFEFEHLEINA